MDAGRDAATNGRAPVVAEGNGAPSELDALRARCRRQATVIDTLGEAISTLRAGTTALKAENADLRADTHWMRGRRALAKGVRVTEERFSSDVQAPAAARAVVTRELRGHVAAPVLAQARLLASELMTNAVLHSCATADAHLVLRVEVSSRMVRLEVQDPGRAGAVAPRVGDGDGGFGLSIVQTVSERWGLERIATGGTRVWAQLALERTRATPATP